MQSPPPPGIVHFIVIKRLASNKKRTNIETVSNHNAWRRHRSRHPQRRSPRIAAGHQFPVSWMYIDENVGEDVEGEGRGPPHLG